MLNIFIDYFFNILYNILNKERGEHKMTLGDIIKNYREQNNITIVEFAKACSVIFPCLKIISIQEITNLFLQRYHPWQKLPLEWELTWILS